MRQRITVGLVALAAMACATPQVQLHELVTADLADARTLTEISRRAGRQPTCKPGRPGHQLCSWDIGEVVCSLPKDGSPRGPASCFVVVRWFMAGSDEALESAEQ
jgi:hypothetical protein